MDVGILSSRYRVQLGGGLSYAFMYDPPRAPRSAPSYLIIAYLGKAVTIRHLASR